jgi:hypothetical protein
MELRIPPGRLNRYSWNVMLMGKEGHWIFQAYRDIVPYGPVWK